MDLLSIAVDVDVDVNKYKYALYSIQTTMQKNTRLMPREQSISPCGHGKIENKYGLLHRESKS